jgi:ribosomal protein S7
MLTRGGSCIDEKIVRAEFLLKIAFQIPDPFALAVESIRPILKYQKSLGAKVYKPILLNDDVSRRLAVKWIIGEARVKRYHSVQIPEMQQALYDEICSVLAGTSKLYAKRFQMHKN